MGEIDDIDWWMDRASRSGHDYPKPYDRHGLIKPKPTEAFYALVENYADSDRLVRQLYSMVRNGCDLVVALLAIVGAYAATREAEHEHLMRIERGLWPAPIVMCSDCPRKEFVLKGGKRVAPAADVDAR